MHIQSWDFCPIKSELRFFSHASCNFAGFTATGTYYPLEYILLVSFNSTHVPIAQETRALLLFILSDGWHTSYYRVIWKHKCQATLQKSSLNLQPIHPQLLLMASHGFPLLWAEVLVVTKCEKNHCRWPSRRDKSYNIPVTSQWRWVCSRNT